mmetsp:Transcript_9006/g.29857  ORF Transcript_9006/g.29857 Transcript_9006/m.29857 type:complete len:323 (-) Transcript_9006:1746-2714(-)
MRRMRLGTHEPMRASRFAVQDGVDLRREVLKLLAQVGGHALQAVAYRLALLQLLLQFRLTRSGHVRALDCREQLVRQALVPPERQPEQACLDHLCAQVPLHLVHLLLGLLELRARRIHFLPPLRLGFLQLHHVHLRHRRVVCRHLELARQLSYLPLQRGLRWRGALPASHRLALGLDVVPLVNGALHVGDHDLLPALQLGVPQLHPVNLPLHGACLRGADRRVERRLGLALERDLLLDQSCLLLRLDYVEQELLFLLLQPDDSGLELDSLLLVLLEIVGEANLHVVVVVSQGALLGRILGQEPVDLAHLNVQRVGGAACLAD